MEAEGYRCRKEWKWELSEAPWYRRRASGLLSVAKHQHTGRYVVCTAWIVGHLNRRRACANSSIINSVLPFLWKGWWNSGAFELFCIWNHGNNVCALCFVLLPFEPMPIPFTPEDWLSPGRETFPFYPSMFNHVSMAIRIKKHVACCICPALNLSLPRVALYLCCPVLSGHISSVHAWRLYFDRTAHIGILIFFYICFVFQIMSVPYISEDWTSRERLSILSMCNKLGETIGGCERLVQTPVPLHYVRHTSRFLTIWCFLLPLVIGKGETVSTCLFRLRESWHYFFCLAALFSSFSKSVFFFSWADSWVRRNTCFFLRTEFSSSVFHFVFRFSQTETVLCLTLVCPEPE